MATTRKAPSRPRSKAAPVVLTASEILDVDDLPEELVEVPEWGGSVRIKGISYGQLADIREASKVGDQIDLGRLQMGLIVAGIVEPKIREDQVELLRGKNQRALDRVLMRVEVLSGIAEEVQAESAEAFPA